LREEIWTLLDQRGLSPVSPFGHIPTFTGVEVAAARLAALDIWKRARVIKANPDTAHVAVRLRALRDGKRLYMAVPRLTREHPFVQLTAADLAEKGVPLEEAARWQVALESGRPVPLEEMEPVDLVLAGCVAVTRGGGRTGKGAGFADLELGMLRDLGLLRSGTPIVAVVHSVQVVDDERVPMEPHDSPLDWIVTPDEVIETHTRYPQPGGVDWEALRPEQVESIPVLQRLRAMRERGE
jgi:5-formyltetrahydrofolate cyclo-ligase